MLNTRIEIDTSDSPYKVNRKRPAILDPYFIGKNDWFIFCERIDHFLQKFEEIKAAWMVLGVMASLLMIGVIVGIICTFVLVEEKDLLAILAGLMFGACFFVFAGYFCFMDLYVVRPLDDFAKKMDEYCSEISAQSDNKVAFRFGRSRKCTIFWDADFKAWIDVSTSEPVDLTEQ
mmetsp:Transcript_20540/g.33022  ORF Transcript_20540/g.33022 Transcript_20540/m.33022 type:complete len:175 (-) Transcript_20540:376-900(-)|eukprot:CAMPEP_0178801712 /NCGR_PEP_ID=MMETSP0745-20121128/13489_1 /TAXON_ID=913974 /ORGANISM="Nitzschia punctata, Strain CCMP561" /LENGTH=174 /DNA_ID=CAMNT_0020460557 /DNA_START=42 /DNA_END=566 /DNA_ORIENTATION=-